MVKLLGRVFVGAGSGRDWSRVHRRRSHLLQNNETAGFVDTLFAMAATRQEHGPEPGPNLAHRPILKPASASTGAHSAPRSSRPRSDSHRSRNLLVTRKPKPNTPHGQKDLEPAP